MENIIKIQFESGKSRHGDYLVNFLISSPFANLDAPLYAEAALPEDGSDDYGYFALKDEIIRQAKERGIEDELVFWHDGQEDQLDDDASARCDIKGW